MPKNSPLNEWWIPEYCAPVPLSSTFFARRRPRQSLKVQAMATVFEQTRHQRMGVRLAPSIAQASGAATIDPDPETDWMSPGREGRVFLPDLCKSPSPAKARSFRWRRPLRLGSIAGLLPAFPSPRHARPVCVLSPACWPCAAAKHTRPAARSCGRQSAPEGAAEQLHAQEPRLRYHIRLLAVPISHGVRRRSQMLPRPRSGHLQPATSR